MANPHEEAFLEQSNELQQPHLESHRSSMYKGHFDVQNEETSSQNSEGSHERDRFNNYTEYLVSVLGFAAGFGSLWRFPYLIFKSGGGAFLIPYFVIMFCVGIPAFYFETALGQMFQKGPPKIFESVGKRFKGLGYLATFIAYNEATYYNLILAYSLLYLWKSFQFPLPWAVDWETHPEPWNKEYFYDQTLHSTKEVSDFGDHGIVWPVFFCYALSQIIVFLCVQKGVAVSGRIALFTATSPYVLLVILMLRGFMLDGAWDGIKYLLTPDLSKLWDLQVWSDAAAQVIFQFSVGIAVLVFFASYRHRSSEIHRSAFLIPTLTVLCGFLSAFTVFSYMGYMCKLTGKTFEELPLQGPDLTFIAYPAVLNMMPFPNLWAIMFFSVMIFLGIDTQFGFMDGVAGTIEDDFGIKGGRVRICGRTFSMRVVRFIICCSVIFTGFLYSSKPGFHYLGFVDQYTTAIPSLISVGIETVFFTHYQDWKEIETLIKHHVRKETPGFFLFFIKYVVPVFCFGLSLQALYTQLSQITQQSYIVTLFGWFITLYPFILAFYIYKKHSSYEYIQKEMDEKKENMDKRLQELGIINT